MAAAPYRAAAWVAMGGLTAHTGHFRGVVDEMREHVRVLRAFGGVVSACPRRLGWALGMGAYFLNMNLALMGRSLDARATEHGFEVAERLGFTDLRIYHLFSHIVRASFTGDGSAFMPPFAEMNDLMRKLGNPRLPERNLAIYTPPYYLERGEVELARAVIERGERLVKLLPGDRWLKLYVEVYRACLHVAAGDVGLAEEAIEGALAVSRASDFRMETLVLVYQSRFELARKDVAAALRAALAALARATDPLRENPFDEILARRALADVQSGAEGIAELSLAMALAESTGNVLQEGIVRYTLAERTWDTDRQQAAAHLGVADARFASARAERWRKRARERRSGPD
jgi:eukaryotic-like serine/threonine-protein kinase